MNSNIFLSSNIVWEDSNSVHKHWRTNYNIYILYYKYFSFNFLYTYNFFQNKIWIQIELKLKLAWKLNKPHTNSFQTIQTFSGSISYVDIRSRHQIYVAIILMQSKTYSGWPYQWLLFQGSADTKSWNHTSMMLPSHSSSPSRLQLVQDNHHRLNITCWLFELK